LKGLFAALAAVVIAGAAPLHAQTSPPLEIGQDAPDFELRGATRYGELKDPVRLSDYSGRTIVLAFFFRARTRG
jgi:hypothetical protein